MDIELNSARLDELFTKLSSTFATGFTVGHGEYSLKISGDLGCGTFTGINYPNGVGLIRLEGTFDRDIGLIYGAHQVHPLRFVYCLNNRIAHRFNNEGPGHTIERYSSAIIANMFPYGDTYTIYAGEPTSVAFLEIDRKVFTGQLPQQAHDMEHIFYEMFFDVHATRTLFHMSPFSLHLANILKEIGEFGQKGYIRTNFIGAKALEMLSLMLLQYEDDLRDRGLGRVLRRSEIDAVHRVAGTINADLANLPGVDELAGTVALTPAKLQEGFRILYGATVNQYIVDRRLERGYSLLSETDSHIGEVVIEIGLSSRSHFSKIFKEKYGLSPNDVKMRRRMK